ncbi:MAG: antibiotic biosynthesis monooxygenase [Zoogloeaceae bacterium]|jgi:quinol monooxygenase YgiN|nr:antibiotic biosynthesis monooxygenase [Zoogloeaceae bacterium]
MIKVVAKNILKDGTKEQVLALLEEMIAETRKEEGCVTYELYELDGSPNTITFIEEWESLARLTAHINSEHFKRVIPAIGKFAAEDCPVEIYRRLK